MKHWDAELITDSNVPKGPVQSDETESWNDQIASHAAQIVAISAPTDQYNSGNHGSNSGAQFQYPPFNSDNGAWSGGNENVTILSGYSIYDNYAVDGMFGPSFGQQSSYNYFPNNGDYNTWGSQQINSASSGGQSRKGQYDEYYRGHGSYQGSVQDGIKSMEQGMQGLNIDMGQSQVRDRANTEQPKEAAPKQMTWASIASQPAKPQIRTSSSSSILKKKGPGMPPPPMVPGKHNMDIGTWDSPKNGPALVPPPVPVITAPPPIEPSPLSQQKSNSLASSAGPLPGQSQSMPMSGGGQQQQQQHNQHQHHQQQMSGQQARPAWSGGNRAPHPGMMAPSQQQRQNMSQSNGPPSMLGFQGQPHQQHQQMMNHPPQHHSQMAPPMPVNNNSNNLFTPTDVGGSSGSLDNPVLEELRDKNEYNPQDFDYESASLARFFVIKSYSEDDIHRSIKYEIWCSTEHGNKRLDQAYREREKVGGIIYLLFSVNSSAHFCGMAQMMTAVDYNTVSNVWSQDKWKGTFKVKWIFVKDVPMREFKNIRLENNEDKPVTNSRDTQEVPNAKGIQFLRILSAYKHSTSIFDDFIHYEKRQKAEDTKKVEPPPMPHYDRGPNKPYHDNGGRGYDRGGYDRGGKSFGGQYNNRGYDNRRGGDDYQQRGNGGFDRRDHNDGGYNRENDGYQRNYMRRGEDRGFARRREGGDEPLGSQVPSMFLNFIGSDIDWKYNTEPETNACLNSPEQRCYWPRGKVLGGTSVLNGMMYIRGNKEDYDEWAAMGNPGWSYDDVLPYFMMSEDNMQLNEVDNGFHATGGMLPISKFPYHPPLSYAILRAGQELGYQINDLNGANSTGFMIAQMTSKNGIRMSASRAYIRPVQKRPNLHVLLNTTVARVLLHPKTKGTHGVEIIDEYGHPMKIFTKKEVIVSGGTVNSPQILLLSGIGPKEDLMKVGVRPVHDLPGVGKNLHNHVAYFTNFYINDTDTSPLNWATAMEYLLFRDGLMSGTGISDVTAKISSKFAENPNVPDLQFYFGGFLASCAKTGQVGELLSNSSRSIQIFPAVLHPKSRGYITLASNDPLAPPKIVANYLTEEHDIQVLVDGVKFAVRLSETEPLKAYGMQVDKTPTKGCESIPFGTDEYWTCAVKQNTGPENHQAGSCKMGPMRDPMAVVDHELRVHGVRGLRVVDASIMPKVTSGNTNGPIIMIAEKAAKHIKRSWGA